ncbi:IS3 family transposase [Herbidospora cretacea]|uniref:IS3 family transposase n=1 Tax=Herbidospora cretacea TaxID=28444 RepID=UPI0007732F3A|nr:IS3 family transposase [Herbidospora cretacea]
MPSPHPPEFRRHAVELARQGDKPLVRLAEDLGISRSCLQKWLQEDGADPRPGTAGQLAELRRGIRQLRRDNDILQRAAHLALGKRPAGVIYGLIRALAADHVPVATACRVLRVSTSGYYEWLKRPESPRELRDGHLMELIRQIHADSRGSYGSPRVHAYLRLRLGEKVNHKRIERLMREAGLRGAHSPKGLREFAGRDEGAGPIPGGHPEREV